MPRYLKPGIFLLLFLCANVIKGQTTLQDTLSSFTIRIDTIHDEHELNTVQATILSHSEVTNYDLKRAKCNFTITQSVASDIYNQIVADLSSAGFTVTLLHQRENQVFTRPPVDNRDKSRKPAEITEEDYIRMHSSGSSPD